LHINGILRQPATTTTTTTKKPRERERERKEGGIMLHLLRIRRGETAV
jgi:hypothetical protein